MPIPALLLVLPQLALLAMPALAFAVTRRLSLSVLLAAIALSGPIHGLTRGVLDALARSGSAPEWVSVGELATLAFALQQLVLLGLVVWVVRDLRRGESRASA